MKKIILLFTLLCSFKTTYTKPTPQLPNYGCANASNSCFLNAAIQALFHTKPLRDYLNKNKQLYTKDSTSQLFINHINSLESATSSLSYRQIRGFREGVANKEWVDYVPEEFQSEIAKMKGTKQHDSKEFLDHILRKLEDEVIVDQAKIRGLVLKPFEDITTDFITEKIIFRLENLIQYPLTFSHAYIQYFFLRAAYEELIPIKRNILHNNSDKMQQIKNDINHLYLEEKAFFEGLKLKLRDQISIYQITKTIGQINDNLNEFKDESKIPHKYNSQYSEENLKEIIAIINKHSWQDLAQQLNTSYKPKYQLRKIFYALSTETRSDDTQNKIALTLQTFLGLPLPSSIPTNETYPVIKSLRQYITKKAVDQRNWISNSQTYEKVSLKSLPKILIMHLGRFKQKNTSFEKIKSKITFPLEIDMQEFLDNDDQEKTIYQLYAIIIHSGATPDSGHYYTYAKHNNSWYLYDDASVSEQPLSDIQAIAHQTQEEGRPYILFYEQTKQKKAPKKIGAVDKLKEKTNSLVEKLKVFKTRLEKLALTLKSSLQGLRKKS